MTLSPRIAQLDGWAEDERLHLNLFPDKSYAARIDRVSVNVNGTITLRGWIEGYPLGSLLISTTGNRSLGSIRIPETGEHFIIQSEPVFATHYLMEAAVETSDEIFAGPTLIPPAPEPGELSEIAMLEEYPAGAPMDPAQIDVMVVYTPAAKAWADISGGGIDNVIAQAMARSQTALDNSQTALIMSLARAAEVDYTESGASNIDLRRLTASPTFNPWGDTYEGYVIPGYMDEVHAWRDQYHADLVTLFAKIEDVGGIAWLLSSSSGRPRYGFSVVRVQQAANTFTPIHEMGHNMGCHHHKLQSFQPGPGLFDYSAGWRWTGNNGGLYCSIMSYTSGTYYPDGKTHIQVGHFSNPSVLHLSAPTGDAVHGDNARTIREVKHALSNYRVPDVSYLLSVNSSGAPGVGIASSTGHDGTTDYTRNLAAGTIVKLTAPAIIGTKGFEGWTGALTSSNPAIEFSMTGNRSVTAQYIGVPIIHLNRTALIYGKTIGGPATHPQQVVVSNAGEGTLDWSAVSGASWLSVAPNSGTGTGAVAVSVNPAGLTAGTYFGQVLFTAPGAPNSPETIDVTLNVYPQGISTAPFGVFDTPTNGATVYGAVPVTGWALDDIQVDRVEIKRSSHPDDPPGAVGTDGLVFISAAIFVEGARPDVEAAFPQHPLSYRAGWGYMLLTNMLPNQGNDTFTLHAFAYDKEGMRVNLGQKTITGNNAGAVKPFGAIDTPGQGEQISGAAFNNFGWALTPQPNMIPTDGSTIRVWVNGVSLGHPAYNYARPALAALFPGLANTSGPVGLTVLDTTAYENGVHTIAWSVVDNGGNADGIGSRFFSILNTAGAEIKETTAETGHPGGPDDDVSSRAGRLRPDWGFRLKDGTSPSLTEVMIFPTRFEPVAVRRGYEETAPCEFVTLDNFGVVALSMREVDRIEIALETGAEPPSFRVKSDHLPKRSGDGSQSEVDRTRGGSFVRPGTEGLGRLRGRQFLGRQIAGEELRALPIGSTLDPASGIFSWQPGPGFLGEYVFVFVCEHADGRRDKAFFRITIGPKF